MTADRQEKLDRGLRAAVLGTGPAVAIALAIFRTAPLFVLGFYMATCLSLVIARIIIRSGLLGGRIMDR